MWKTIIAEKVISGWNYMVVKGGFVASTLLTGFLTLIGYPKAVITFIIALVIIDVLSRWIAETVTTYGSFTIGNFFRAWKHKVLNSKKLKAGLFIKVFFYSALLIIAHQALIVPELYFGELISNFIYSIMIVLDGISICENMIESGYEKGKVIMEYLIKIKDMIIKK